MQNKDTAKNPSGDKDAPEKKGAEQAVKNAAEKTKSLEPTDAKSVTPQKVEVLTKTHETPTEEAVADEAKKGYDMLFIGVDPSVSEPGAFHPNVSRIAAGFEGPLAVVIAGEKHKKRPAESRFKILVPVTGTAVSRRGAEVGLALAHAANAKIGALYVSTAPSGRVRGKLRRALLTRRAEQAILKDIVELADNFDTTMTVSYTHLTLPTNREV